jgi:DNA-binding NarL/FixJ family response regulator
MPCVKKAATGSRRARRALSCDVQAFTRRCTGVVDLPLRHCESAFAELLVPNSCDTEAIQRDSCPGPEAQSTQRGHPDVGRQSALPAGFGSTHFTTGSTWTSDKHGELLGLREAQCMYLCFNLLSFESVYRNTTRACELTSRGGTSIVVRYIPNCCANQSKLRNSLPRCVAKGGKMAVSVDFDPVSNAAAYPNAPHQTQTSHAVDNKGPKMSTVVIIERRTLIRECITLSLKATSPYEILAFASIDEWLGRATEITASLVVLSTPSSLPWHELEHQIALLTQSKSTPVGIISDLDEGEQVVRALEIGARGVIPTDTPVEVVIGAFALIQAGGVFVPASSLVSARKENKSCAVGQLGSQMFTARQAAVVEALRRGKANKIIAYELNMRESTVKVHVRNIMKKLKARNRTEVAFMTNTSSLYTRP